MDLDEMEFKRATENLKSAAAQFLASHAGSGEHSEYFVAIRSNEIVAVVGANLESPILASCSSPVMSGNLGVEGQTQLLRTAIDYLNKQGVTLTTLLQADIPPPTLESLKNVGFQHGGDVAFCLCQRHRFPESLESPLELVPFDGDQETFADLISETCRDTQDLPALLATWPPHQMVTHLISVHGPLPRLWFTVRGEGENVGVLLIDPQEEHYRLVYLGLVPEHRAKGWGQSLLRHAMHIAAQERTERMLLSVDCNNAAALHIYSKAGFLTYLTQSLYFRPNHV